MKSLNEIKNDGIKYRSCESEKIGYKQGFEHCEAELIQKSKGKKLWVMKVYNSRGYFEAYEQCHFNESQIQFIEMTDYNALQIKLDKAFEALKDLQHDLVLELSDEAADLGNAKTKADKIALPLLEKIEQALEAIK